jgi:hypothetical protein
MLSGCSLPNAAKPLALQPGTNKPTTCCSAAAYSPNSSLPTPQAVLQSRPRPPPGLSDPDATKPLVLQPTLTISATFFSAAASAIPPPFQAVLQSRPRPPPGFSDPDAAKPLVLQPGTKAVWVGSNYFGCVATVLADPSAKITGRGANQGTYYVRVQVCVCECCESATGRGTVVCGDTVGGGVVSLHIWSI